MRGETTVADSAQQERSIVIEQARTHACEEGEDIQLYSSKLALAAQTVSRFFPVYYDRGGVPDARVRSRKSPSQH